MKIVKPMATGLIFGFFIMMGLTLTGCTIRVCNCDTKEKSHKALEQSDGSINIELGVEEPLH